MLHRHVATSLVLLGLATLPACGGGGESSGGQNALPGPQGSIVGVITGPVIEGVTVALTGPTDATTTTDASGEFRFSDLLPGSYAVTPVPTTAAHFTPTSITVESNNDSQDGLSFVSNVPAPPAGFPNIGSELYAWGWAGDGGSNLSLVGSSPGSSITLMSDLSGLGHHFFNNGDRKAAFAPNLDLDASTLGGAYSTSLPLIGLHRWPNGSDHFGSVYYWSEGMNATADFYIVCAMVNTRDNGVRDFFGTDETNLVRMDQSDGDVYLRIAGVDRKVSSNQIDHGPLVLEIWRTAGGDITVYANGQDVTAGSINMTGTFDVNGFGFDQTGTSYFDDYLMELVYCDALPPAPERDDVREYLRQKWGLY